MGIIKSLKNIFRENIDKVDDSLKDPVRDGKYAIEDSKKKIAELRENLRTIKIQNTGLKTKKTALESKIGTLQGTLNKIVEKAKAATGVEADGHKAKAKLVFDEIEGHNGELKTLDSEIDKNNKVITNTETQIKRIETAIDGAAQDQDRLKVRLEGAKARQALAETQDKYNDGDDNPLAQLDDLRKQVEKEEAKADVMDEEVSAQSDNAVESVVEEYAGVGSSSDKFDALFK